VSTGETKQLSEQALQREEDYREFESYASQHPIDLRKDAKGRYVFGATVMAFQCFRAGRYLYPSQSAISSAQREERRLLDEYWKKGCQCRKDSADICDLCKRTQRILFPEEAPRG
jgi:hypothetical protein